jgi:putative FmdB family regulatory protein
VPIFDYKCKKCEELWEEIVLRDEKVECPKCGSKCVKKLMGASHFRMDDVMSDSKLRGEFPDE